MDSPETVARRWSGGAARRGGGLSVAGNDVTGSCTTEREREREEGEAPSTVKQKRKGHAESEAHWRGRGRCRLSTIPPRGERLGGSGVVAGVAGDEEGGRGASGMNERGMGRKRGTGSGWCLLWRPGGTAERKARGFQGRCRAEGGKQGREGARARRGTTWVGGIGIGPWPAGAGGGAIER
jgi:hypothetical protein